MRAMVHRVRWARAVANDKVVGRIGAGLLVYVKVTARDAGRNARLMADMVASVWIRVAKSGKRNRRSQDPRCRVLAILGFHHLGDDGNNEEALPSGAGKISPESKEAVFKVFLAALLVNGLTVGRAVFGADVRVLCLRASATSTLILT
jgi:D-tyrosyl-tRNA(Tyr) deacylase